LGRAAVEHLVARAVDRGVEILIASVLPGRTELLDALGAVVGPRLSTVVDSDGVTARFALPDPPR
jgi:hypothetical protein